MMNEEPSSCKVFFQRESTPFKNRPSGRFLADKLTGNQSIRTISELQRRYSEECFPPFNVRSEPGFILPPITRSPQGYGPRISHSRIGNDANYIHTHRRRCYPSIFKAISPSRGLNSRSCLMSGLLLEHRR